MSTHEQTLDNEATGAIKKAWLSYVSAVLPEQCGIVQYDESRKCFYAGCACMFGLLQSAPSDDEEVAHYVEKIAKELQHFQKQLMVEIEELENGK